MKSHSAFSVKTILTRGHFDCATVVAGHQGLDRLVKWVHVFEITEVRENLKGGELVLSTGFGWKGNEELFLSLLEQLIQRRVAGLCIELGSFIDTIPNQAVELANRHHFPIITFEKEVSFVEITQDIHSDLINRQYELISNLEDYAQRLNKKLLSIDNSFEILKYLQQYLNCQLVCISDDHQDVIIPAVKETERKELLKRLHASSDKKVLSQPVQVFEREFATIYLLSEHRNFGEFESLLLDRTATAMAQYLLRELYTEEKRKAEETEWMLEWLQGVHSSEEIKEHLTYYKINEAVSGAVVLIVKLKKGQLQADLTYLNMLIQNVFDQNGYFVFPVEKRHLLTFILLNKEGEENWRERVLKGILRLEKILEDSNASSSQIAGGKYVRSLGQIHESFKTAQETLSIQVKVPPGQHKYFYEDMHMYRLISLVHKHSNLNNLVQEYLEPIIEYDQKNNTNLLHTLKVYLSCNGSKKETAKQIFVVRQTLYHRLEKLEQLLGKDFMEAEKRQVIEFSILAYEYQQTIAK
ncbi:PucR family transcriptional regulator [Halobacillus sp. A5]|uniref:PucR family transcriptional regulator n=1 Tax=Halobacillus sp. A5 TaxID=2880263 RepID=UPI0020A671C2|nr:PucR family transcriptional regulator [Halobacillus sp. A5]MCP3026572.1 PucR family transcriptional regulator ligand-binding domain-containing protein [Halobacillus sp. A5]